MPKKRPIEQRVREATEKVERLKDEDRLIKLREKIRNRTPRNPRRNRR